LSEGLWIQQVLLEGLKEDLSTVQNALKSNKLLRRRDEKKTGEKTTTFTGSEV
jgi:hypothetical protein